MLSLARHEGRLDGRADRALRGGGRAKSRWSASTCSRRSAASTCRASSGAASAAIENVIAIKIAPFNRYRTLDVVQRRGRRARRGPRHALHRQRRPHRARPGERRSRCMRGREEVRGAHQGRPARPLERLDEIRPSSCSSASRLQSATADRDRPAGARRARSPTATARSSTSRTISPAASPAATRCCGGRGCSRAPGASIPQESAARRGRSEEIDRVYAAYPRDERRRLLSERIWRNWLAVEVGH